MEPPLMVSLKQNGNEEQSSYMELEESSFVKTVAEPPQNREASIQNSEAVDLEIRSASLLALGTLQVSESGIGRKPHSSSQDDPALEGGIKIKLRVPEVVANPSSPQQKASLLPTLESCCDGCATLRPELETATRRIAILEEEQQNTSRIARAAERKLNMATALVGAAGRKLDAATTLVGAEKTTLEAIETLTSCIRLQENQHQDTARQLEAAIKRIDTLERQHQQRTGARAALATPRVPQTAAMNKSGQIGHCINIRRSRSFQNIQSSNYKNSSYP